MHHRICDRFALIVHSPSGQWGFAPRMRHRIPRSVVCMAAMITSFPAQMRTSRNRHGNRKMKTCTYIHHSYRKQPAVQGLRRAPTSPAHLLTGSDRNAMPYGEYNCGYSCDTDSPRKTDGVEKYSTRVYSRWRSEPSPRWCSRIEGAPDDEERSR